MRVHPDQLLGRLITHRREQLGLTRPELARIISSDPRVSLYGPRDKRFIWRVDRGQTISPVYLEPFADALELELKTLLRPTVID